MKIWMLFSVENNYDQPENNLVGWWSVKPSFQTLAKAVGWYEFPCATDEATLFIVNLWQGQTVKNSHNTEYRLKEVYEGVL